jgi:hypothetical protein
VLLNIRALDLIFESDEMCLVGVWGIKTTLYYKKTLEVGKHHTMDPIMEGILSCSLASSRGNPPNELHAPNTILLFTPLHCLNPFI